MIHIGHLGVWFFGVRKYVRKSWTEIHFLWTLIISQQTRQSSALRAALNILLEQMSAATIPEAGWVARQQQKTTDALRKESSCQNRILAT